MSTTVVQISRPSRPPWHLLAATVFAFATAVLLILCTFSAPFINPIHFLHADGRVFGLFGYAPSWEIERGQEAKNAYWRAFGYVWQPQIPSHVITRCFVLYGVAGGLALLDFVALLFFYLSWSRRRPPVVAKLLSILTTVVTAVAFGFSTYVFVSARASFLKLQVPGTGFGPAFYMSIAALVSSVLAACAGSAMESDDNMTTKVTVHGDVKKKTWFKRADRSQSVVV